MAMPRWTQTNSFLLCTTKIIRHMTADVGKVLLLRPRKPSARNGRKPNRTLGLTYPQIGLACSARYQPIATISARCQPSQLPGQRGLGWQDGSAQCSPDCQWHMIQGFESQGHHRLYTTDQLW
eukprot:479131-Pyramimonas_sp.AAC.1